MSFTYYEIDSAPDEAKVLMQQSIAAFGMLPNLHKILAEAPATYQAYNTLFELFMKNTSLSAIEQQVVFMTANFENRCHYCVPGHTWMMKTAKMPDDLIDALREGKAITDAKLRALHDFTKALLDNRGHVGNAQLSRFLSAGFTQRQALEVLTGLAAKLISNFTNAITHTQIDEPMQPYAWQHPDER